MVGIVAKVSHPDAENLCLALLSWLKERSLPFLVEHDTASALELTGVPHEARVAREEMSTHCEIIVVLGGDGTLISVCGHPSPTPPTIVGVNLGTLGFLTEVTPSELFLTLEQVLDKTAVIKKRILFDCQVYRENEVQAQFSAINDVVITKQALARIFALEVLIDDEPAAVVRGDGVIVATPAGSTAYSLAAGGSIVHPEVSAVLLTPICPHSLTSRPLILPGSSTVRLQLLNHTSENEVYLTVDGQTGMALTPKDSVYIQRSERHILVATSPSKSYFEVLNTKLKWAAS